MALTGSLARKLCWMHIGKTGGTYLSTALRRLAKSSDLDMDFVSHKRNFRRILTDNPDHMVVFGIRDPLELYVSGFYSRQRKGAPRYNVEWSEGEAEAFGRFATANELAEALSSRSRQERKAAARAMAEIGHVKRNLKGYLVSRDFVARNRRSIFFVFGQNDLDEDLRVFYDLFGQEVPAKLAENEALKHRNPDYLDRTLSPLGTANLEKHYAEDLRIFHECVDIRNEILSSLGDDKDSYFARINAAA